MAVNLDDANQSLAALVEMQCLLATALVKKMCSLWGFALHYLRCEILM